MKGGFLERKRREGSRKGLTECHSLRLAGQEPNRRDAATRSKREKLRDQKKKNREMLKCRTPGAFAFLDGDRGKEVEWRIQENETQVKRPLPFRVGLQCGPRRGTSDA
jgi:hypothetical protein